MKKFPFHYIVSLIVLFGCGKDSIIITPPEEENFKVEVVYLDETESIVEFLNPAQTGLLTSETMRPPSLIMLSYSQFIDDLGNKYDTTFAYALFRDMNSPPINMGRWRERRGLDIGDIYVENTKLEKSIRKIRTPSHYHGWMDTSYGIEYKLKMVNFNFKHSAKHRFKIIDKSGSERVFELETPDKKELEGLPEHAGKGLKLKLKSRADSLDIIVSVPLYQENESIIKPIMILKFKNLFTQKIKIDSSIVNLIPNEYRQSYLIFSIVQGRKRNINIPGFPENIMSFTSSTLYFKVKFR
ncbi:MAG: hypothetical protein N2252_04425 [Candidatus Kryptonium sp.]|nr:hypothetical protein [Candidatus Kryptonium sp.]